MSVEDMIASAKERNLDLVHWENHDAKAWNEALKQDEILRRSSKWVGAPFDERFAEVVKRVREILPEASTPPNKEAVMTNNPLHVDEIRAIAINCGFKKKPQPDGEDDLNPYVYDFANALWEELQCRQSASRLSPAQEDEPVAFRMRHHLETDERDWTVLDIRFLERNKHPSYVYELLYTRPAYIPWWKFIGEYKNADEYMCRKCEQKFFVHKDGVCLPEECPSCKLRKDFA
jgi:hypothetical protein